MQHQKNDIYKKKSPEASSKKNCRRKILRPSLFGAKISLNFLFVFSLLLPLSIGAYFFDVWMAYDTVKYMFIPIISVMCVGIFCAKKCITHAFLYRDGMIRRLLHDIKSKKDLSTHYNQQIQHLIQTSNLCPWTASLSENAFLYIGVQIDNISGLSSDAWLTKGYFLEHIVPQDRKIWLDVLKNKSKRESGFITLEYRIRHQNGKIIWVRNSFFQTTEDNHADSTAEYVLKGFLQDITEQKNIEYTLRMARQEAEEANHTKSHFLAAMSHELRTPLNSIIGFANVIKNSKETLNPEVIGHYAENIHDSGRHLLELINDILDSSKIEAGKFDVVPDITDLRDIFKACDMLLRERAMRSDLAFKILIPQEAMIIYADAKRLKQVLLNLLTNAIKFTPAGGSVGMDYQVSAKKHLRITVYDTGIGIKPEHIDHVFEKFNQVDMKKNRHQEGTGLGLAIAKSLIDMHHGSIHADSIYGKGTMMHIDFKEDIFKIPSTNQGHLDIAQTGS